MRKDKIGCFSKSGFKDSYYLFHEFNDCHHFLLVHGPASARLPVMVALPGSVVVVIFSTHVAIFSSTVRSLFALSTLTPTRIITTEKPAYPTANQNAIW